MAAAGHDILLLEQARLVHLRVEHLPHERVVHILGPADEMVHGALGAVRVVDLDAVALRLQLVAGGLEAVRRLSGHQRHGLQVAVHARAYEIIGAVVPNLQNSVGHHVSDVHKIAAVFFRLHRLLFLAGWQRGEAQSEQHEHEDMSGFLHRICTNLFLFL